MAIAHMWCTFLAFQCIHTCLHTLLDSKACPWLWPGIYVRSAMWACALRVSYVLSGEAHLPRLLRKMLCMCSAQQIAGKQIHHTFDICYLVLSAFSCDIRSSTFSCES